MVAVGMRPGPSWWRFFRFFRSIWWRFPAKKSRELTSEVYLNELVRGSGWVRDPWRRNKHLQFQLGRGKTRSKWSIFQQVMFEIEGSQSCRNAVLGSGHARVSWCSLYIFTTCALNRLNQLRTTHESITETVQLCLNCIRLHDRKKGGTSRTGPTFAEVWFANHYWFVVWDNPSHWLIFFRGVETTNQIILYIQMFFQIPSCNLLHSYWKWP